MNVGATANDFGLVIVLMLGSLLALSLLFGLGTLIGRLLGGKASMVAPLFMIVAVVALFYGGSLYMDSAGEFVQGEVFQKHESVRIREEGDWRHTLQVAVRYRVDGSTPTSEFVNYDDGGTTLALSSQQFDSLREKESVQLRVLPLWRSITLVRLASMSTRDLVPMNWLLIGLGVALLLLVGWRVGKTRVGCAIIAVVVFVLGLGLPSLIMYRDWLAMEDLGAKPLRAQASVSAVRRITHIDPFPCHTGGCSRWDTDFDVPQQYDIVQFSFTPQGARDTVIGVDAADAGTFGGQVGDSVEIAYNADDPRAVQIIGATHSHHCKNMLGFIGIMGATGALLLAILLAFSWFGKGFKHLFNRASQRSRP